MITNDQQQQQQNYVWPSLSHSAKRHSENNSFAERLTIFTGCLLTSDVCVL